MTPDYTIRPSIRDDCAKLGPRLRRSDMDEIAFATGRAPVAELLAGFECARRCYSAELNGSLVVMFGVGQHAKTPPGHGVIWMLGAQELDQYPKLLSKLSRHWLLHLSEGYSTVGNVVPTSRTRTLRWLEWLGFRRIRLRPNYRGSGVAFWEFGMNVTQVPESTHAREEP